MHNCAKHTSSISMTVSVLEHSHLVLAFMCMDDEISIWENEYRYLIIIIINAIFREINE